MKTPIKNLQDPKYILLQTSQDIEHVAEIEAFPEINDFEMLLVSTVGGEYEEIWGVFGIPYLERFAYQLKSQEDASFT
jgi:hypothetical protein